LSSKRNQSSACENKPSGTRYASTALTCFPVARSVVIAFPSLPGNRMRPSRRWVAQLTSGMSDATAGIGTTQLSGLESRDQVAASSRRSILGVRYARRRQQDGAGGDRKGQGLGNAHTAEA
jgi:hypothetical protein